MVTIHTRRIDVLFNPKRFSLYVVLIRLNKDGDIDGERSFHFVVDWDSYLLLLVLRESCKPLQVSPSL